MGYQQSQSITARKASVQMARGMQLWGREGAVRTVGPRPCSPAGVRVCTVIFFWKLSSDTPLYMRAARQTPHLTITTVFPASFRTCNEVNEGRCQDESAPGLMHSGRKPGAESDYVAAPNETWTLHAYPARQPDALKVTGLAL